MLLLGIHVITKINDQTKRNKLPFKLFLKQNWRFMKGYFHEVLEKKQLTSCSLFDTWCKRGTATIKIKEFRFSKWNLNYLSLGTSILCFEDILKGKYYFLFSNTIECFFACSIIIMILRRCAHLKIKVYSLDNS